MEIKDIAIQRIKHNEQLIKTIILGLLYLHMKITKYYYSVSQSYVMYKFL